MQYPTNELHQVGIIDKVNGSKSPNILVSLA